MLPQDKNAPEMKASKFWGLEEIKSFKILWFESILNKYKVEKNGEKVAIIGLGNFLNLAKETALEIKNTLGIDPTIINPRFITGIDKELLTKIQENHSVVITLEDGVVDGGFGEKITRFYGKSNIKVLNYGAKKEFTDRIALDDLYKK